MGSAAARRLAILASMLLGAAACDSILGIEVQTFDGGAGVDGAPGQDATGGDSGSDSTVEAEADAAGSDSTMGEAGPDGLSGNDGAVGDATTTDVTGDAIEDATLDVIDGGGVDASSDANADAMVDAAAESGAEGGTCTLGNDANCGACGYACVGGRTCSAGVCTPAWLPTSTTGVPSARLNAAAATIGGQLLVAGGDATGPAFTDSWLYDPSQDTWTQVGALNTGRCGYQMVASASQAYAFSGLTNCQNGTTTTGTLEAYNPSGESWTVVNATGTPTARYSFGSVWTGAAMFIYGGSGNGFTYSSSGAMFDPAGPSWSDATCSLANSERGFSALFLSGSVVYVWGGGGGNAPAGLQYDLVGQSWSSWTLPANTPTIAGLTYGDDGRRIYFLNPTNTTCPATFQVLTYDRVSNSWLAPDNSSTPTGLTAAYAPAGAWVGSEFVVWSGSCGGTPSAVGGRYQPPAPP
jgi:hypothetical protein